MVQYSHLKNFYHVKDININNIF